MELPVCRACLRNEADGDVKFANLFTCNFNGDIDELLLCDMLISCSNIMIQQDDGLPKCICSACISTLKIAYKFRVTCQSSNKWLLENYSLKQVKEEPNLEHEGYKYSIPIEIEGPCTSKDLSLFCKPHNIIDVKVEQTFSNKGEDDDDEQNCDFYNNFETPEETIETLEDTILGKRKHVKCRKKKSMKNVRLKKDRFHKTLQCSQCPKMFRFPYLLQKHIESHTQSGMKNYFCPICEKGYKSEVEHNKTHKNKSKFKCDICSKGFDTKQKVQIHLETHSSNRPKTFLCEVPGCDKAYISVQGLNRHKVLHSGAKNFLCHLCSKAFADKAGLVLHMPFHFNVRNYKCRMCGKEFFTPSNRNQHEQRHGAERRFPCGQCERRFFNRVALNRHMLTHTNELQHHCAFCAKKFARMDNKKRHEFVIHGFSGTRDKNVIIDYK